MAVVLRCFKKRGPYGRWIFMGFVLFTLLQLFVNMEPSVFFSMPNIKSTRIFNDLSDVSGPSLVFLDENNDNQKLIHYVRKDLIEPASSLPYNLTNAHIEHPPRDQSRKIDNYLKKQKSGIFVDIGAHDGEQESVTLFFERFRNWTGLLVEPDPKIYNQLVGKRRKSSTINVCLQTSNTESHMSFAEGTTTKKVPCVWIKTLLNAFNKESIDLLNIDVRGLEIDILKSIPYDRFHIRIIAIEFSNDILSNLPELFKYMDQEGFQALHQYVNKYIKKTDLIFVNKKNNLPLTVT